MRLIMIRRGLGLSLARRPVAHSAGALHRLQRLRHREQLGGLDRLVVAGAEDREQRAGSGGLVRRLENEDAVVIAERIVEADQLAARRFEQLPQYFAAV